ncbi:MAG: hypothetical protein K2N25_05655, partial [Muribaculaceae bacterium]|nr:hypothetical protein [Muribaculaceae bacterium]
SNYGGCSKADSGEVIEVDEFDDFVCPECGQELQVSLQPAASAKKVSKTKKNQDGKKGGNTKLFIIIGAVVAVAIIIAIVFALLDSKKDAKVVEPATTEVAADDDLDMYKDEEVSSDDPLEIVDEPAEAYEPDEKIYEEPVVVEHMAKKPAANTPDEPAAAKPTQPSSHNLGYGTWTGGMKNGQPHGTGTLTYSTSRTIDSRDSKGRVAEPGEYVVGEWDNGHLVQGRWFKNDGSKEAIIIGKAG